MIRRSSRRPASSWRRASGSPRPSWNAGLSERLEPAVTTDGRAVRLLANAGTVAEVEAALAAGAEGIGLLRTELAFLEAQGWPSEDAHVAALQPMLAPLAEPGGHGAHARFRRRQDAAVPARLGGREHARAPRHPAGARPSRRGAGTPGAGAAAGLGGHDLADPGADGDRRGRDRRRARGRACRSRRGGPGLARPADRGDDRGAGRGAQRPQRGAQLRLPLDRYQRSRPVHYGGRSAGSGGGGARRRLPPRGRATGGEGRHRRRTRPASRWTCAARRRATPRCCRCWSDSAWTS